MGTLLFLCNSVIDDNKFRLQELKGTLNGTHSVEWCVYESEALERLSQGGINLALLPDRYQGHIQGDSRIIFVPLARQVRQMYPDLPIIMPARFPGNYPSYRQKHHIEVIQREDIGAMFDCVVEQLP